MCLHYAVRLIYASDVRSIFFVARFFIVVVCYSAAATACDLRRVERTNCIRHRNTKINRCPLGWQMKGGGISVVYGWVVNIC